MRRNLLEGLPGLELGITSNEAFLLEKLPRRILIVGGGYVALEFANIFHGLGAETRIVHRGDRMLRGFDDDLRAHMHIETERAGIKLTMKTTLTKIAKEWRRPARHAVYRRTRGHRPGAVRHRPPSEHRAASGSSAPASTVDKYGAVVVDEYSRSSVDSVYAIGDVTNRVNLTPVAIRDGHAFADTIYNNRPTPWITATCRARCSAGRPSAPWASARATRASRTAKSTSTAPTSGPCAT